MFSGSILGWSALHYMLKREGVYGYLCMNLDVVPETFGVLGNTTVLASPLTVDDDVDDIEDTIAPSVQVSYFICMF